jgi:hypothetical protein
VELSSDRSLMMMNVLHILASSLYRIQNVQNNIYLLLFNMIHVPDKGFVKNPEHVAHIQL